MISNCQSGRDTLDWDRSVLYRDGMLEVTDNELIIEKMRLLRFPWSIPTVIRIKDIEHVSRTPSTDGWRSRLRLRTRRTDHTIKLKLRGGRGMRDVRPEKPADAYHALVTATATSTALKV